MVLADILKQPAKFDCLKPPVILQLESLSFTPFHLISVTLFALAVIHTLFAYKLHNYARHLELKQRAVRGKKKGLLVQLLFFLSEVEVIFALWAIPLFLAICFFYEWKMGLEYINTRDYTEPLFVVVILAMASTKPIVQMAEKLIEGTARLFGGSLSAWWFVLLTIGPLLGSFITEAAAMALCALLLAREFYEYRPSAKLAYATLALLFVNISVGGVLTDFASPAVLVLAHCWEWTMGDMFFDFGWKAALGIVLANFLYWLIFRKELILLNARKKASKVFAVKIQKKEEKNVPFWVMLVHILFMSWIVITSHYPAIFIASFLFFIAFYQATRDYQYPLHLGRPLMIGLFLAGLVIHGGLQAWWVAAILKDLNPLSVMGVAMGLTGFNDNTLISYLGTLIPSGGDAYEYAIFTGVIAGGGLTIIANAPNPAGYSILKRYFHSGVSPVQLFVAALIPTLILYAIFYFFGPLFIT
jgi:hypothetical protein